ncbi:MAG TPA: hypothetical protein VKB80_07820 [Kofleriaceae bacterium]|nr:hypothetical protein [Kofleriaceae bacterium]
MSLSRNLATLSLMMAVCAAGCAQSPEPIGRLGAALEVGPEREVEPPVTVRAPASFVGELFAKQNVLRGLAYDVQNDTYVAVWSDGREYFPAVQDSAATYGARISRTGTLLDPAGFRVAEPEILDGAPDSGFVNDVACSDSGVCLLVGDRQSSQSGPHATRAVRIAGNQVLDDGPFVIAQNMEGASVAWDGTAFRVAMGGSGPDRRVYIARIGVDGLVEAPFPMTPQNSDSGRVACEGSRCLVSYRDQDSLARMVRVVDVAGPVSDEVPLPASWPRYGGGEPCWDGTQYWLAYIDAAPAVRAVRVAADGTLIDPIGVEVAPVSGFISLPGRTAIALACADDHVVITWSTPVDNDSLTPPHRAWVARVALDGTVLDPGGVEIAATQLVTGPGAQGGNPVACGAGQCLVTWRGERNWAGTARATRLVGATALDPEGIDLITSPPGQAAAVAAHAGERTFVAWNDSRPASTDSSDRQLRGSVLTSDLEPLASVEPGVEPTCPGGAGDHQPAVAASATSFLVAWRGGCLNGGVLAQVIDPQGQAVAPTFALSTTPPKEEQPAAASDGAGFLVAWNSGASIRARLLDAAGSLLGADSFAVAASGASAVAAFDGASYVLVYQRASDLFAARVSTDGVVLDPQGIAIATDSAREQEQSMACGGGECLVAWRRGTATGTRSVILAARLAPDGTLLDPGGFQVSLPNLHGGTAVAFSGQSFVVAWREGEGEVRGAEVALDGTPIGTAGFLISPSGELADRPALVSNGAALTIALYDRFDDSPAFHVRRVRARAIASGAPGASP